MLRRGGKNMWLRKRDWDKQFWLMLRKRATETDFL